MADGRANNGGAREGSGRKPIEKRLSQYDECISLLDKDAPKNLQFLMDTRDNEDEAMRDRLKCAEIIAKKTLPDKSKTELDGNIKTDISLVIDPDEEDA